jgi:hypothetical protein
MVTQGQWCTGKKPESQSGGKIRKIELWALNFCKFPYACAKRVAFAALIYPPINFSIFIVDKNHLYKWYYCMSANYYLRHLTDN